MNSRIGFEIRTVRQTVQTWIAMMVTLENSRARRQGAVSIYHSILSTRFLYLRSQCH
jgi:hypothetical protein